MFNIQYILDRIIGNVINAQFTLVFIKVILEFIFLNKFTWFSPQYTNHVFFFYYFRRLEPYRVLLAFKMSLKWLVHWALLIRMYFFVDFKNRSNPEKGSNKMSFCISFFFSFPLIKGFAFLINQYTFHFLLLPLNHN